MTSIIDRLLDEAEKAQRKGHLVLAEVCRDASDQLGLVMEERDRLSDAFKRIAELNVETFHINPLGGGNICVEGSDRFAHERDVAAVFEVVRAALKGDNQ
jgi:hypothetical protein